MKSKFFFSPGLEILRPHFVLFVCVYRFSNRSYGTLMSPVCRILRRQIKSSKPIDTRFDTREAGPCIICGTMRNLHREIYAAKFCRDSYCLTSPMKCHNTLDHCVSRVTFIKVIWSALHHNVTTVSNWHLSDEMPWQLVPWLKRQTQLFLPWSIVCLSAFLKTPFASKSTRPSSVSSHMIHASYGWKQQNVTECRNSYSSELLKDSKDVSCFLISHLRFWM